MFLWNNKQFRFEKDEFKNIRIRFDIQLQPDVRIKEIHNVFFPASEIFEVNQETILSCI